ncbi:MAG: ferritin-like domain-containing protein [Candidatus Aenigmatarchaeota archaeon]
MGIVTYLYLSERRRTKIILERLEKVDFRTLQEKIEKLVEEENKYFSRLFEMEIQLENYRKAAWIIGEKVDSLEEKFKEIEKLPKDYEMTYRDVVRKILEMENKFNDRFKMLTEAVLELGKKRKGK